MLPSFARKSFFEILADTEANINEFVNNPGVDMTRHRRCPFTDTIMAIINFSMSRTNTELFNFFTKKNQVIPSKSAFTQQRKKLSAALFPHLLNSLNEKIPLKKTFKGFHLVAVDGTDINLPTDKNDDIYRIKQARSDNYYYQLHLNAMYDILENRYITATAQPRPQMNERKEFYEMAESCNMPGNTIFIADRGYVSSNTIAHLLESKKLFLIRSKDPSGQGSFTKYIMDPEVETDKMVSLNLTRRYGKYKKNPRTYKHIQRQRPFDFLDIDDHESVYKMNLRCTCIKIGEDSYEYLFSNIPMEAFSAAELKELYWKRWSIETSFRSLKYAFSAVYLHSVNRDLIIQEIFAKLLLFNFTAIIHAYAQQSEAFLEICKNRKQKYKVSFDDAVPIAKEMLVLALKDKKVKMLLLMHLTAVKMNVAPPRRLRSQTVKPLNNRA